VEGVLSGFHQQIGGFSHGGTDDRPGTAVLVPQLLHDGILRDGVSRRSNVCFSTFHVPLTSLMMFVTWSMRSALARLLPPNLKTHSFGVEEEGSFVSCKLDFVSTWFAGLGAKALAVIKNGTEHPRRTHDSETTTTRTNGCRLVVGVIVTVWVFSFVASDSKICGRFVVPVAVAVFSLMTVLRFLFFLFGFFPPSLDRHVCVFFPTVARLLYVLTCGRGSCRRTFVVTTDRQ
jgi:hypothetical protein